MKAADEPIEFSLAAVTRDLNEYGLKFEEKLSPSGQPYLFLGWGPDTEEYLIMITFKLDNDFLWVSTIGLLRDIPTSMLPVFLKLNDRLPLGKFFIHSDELPRLQDDELQLGIEYGFEIGRYSYTKVLLYDHLDLLMANLEHYISEYRKQGLIEDKNLYFPDSRTPTVNEKKP